MTATANILAASVASYGLWDVLVTVLIFAFFSVLVVALFNQPGQVRLSPLREAAIATGHSDRKSVFENAYVRPFLWLLLAVAHRLSVPRLKRWIARTLLAGGNPNYYTPEEYLALAMFTGLVLGASMMLVHLLLLGSMNPTPAILGLVVGFTLTLGQLHAAAASRLRKVAKRIPYALDLIALAMGAGATFTEAVRTVAREDRGDPFHVELNALLAEIELGSTRRRALENLAIRVPLDALKSIVASVIQAEELGTPLGEVLHAQASLMRLQRSVRAENAAAAASVRILVPCLLILISVVLTLFAPAILRFVRQGGLF